MLGMSFLLILCGTPIQTLVPTSQQADNSPSQQKEWNPAAPQQNEPLGQICKLPAAPDRDALVGGGYAEADINQADIKDAAIFAIDSKNSQLPPNDNNQLLSIVSAQTQVVAGINYRLILSLSQHGQPARYEIIVFNQSWTQTKQITSFRDI